MTGPVDTYVTRLSSGSYLQRSSPSQPWWAPVNVNWTYSAQALRHPALVRNARRPDGTRPMSPWKKEWFQMIAAPTTWGVRAKPGFNVQELLFRSISPINTVPSNWNILSNQIPFSPSLQIASDQIARTKVLGKLSQKKWDIGVTALELKQTAGLVTDLSVGIVRQVEKIINSRKRGREQLNAFFRDVRRQGSFDLAAKNVGMTDISLLQDIRSQWMQYQFGIKPAVMDVDNAVTFLSDAVNQHGFKVLVAAKAGHESEDTRSNLVVGSMSGEVRINAKVREVCQTHYSLVYELPTGHVSTRQALGLDNPGNIAWEVTRLSWMVDYAVGVGDWLQSFTAANGMVFKEGCKSRLRRVSSLDFIPSGGPNGSIQRGRATLSPAPREGGSFFERGDFERTLLTSGLIPAFVPQIKSELGLVQLANSLFAMSSVLGGKPGLR